MKKKKRKNIVWINFKRNRLAVFGLIVLVMLVLMAIFADVIADYQKDALEHHSEIRMQPPSKEHWFGADAYGRDVFARIVFGSRISLSIGLITTFVALVVGGTLGGIAGYYGKAVDNIIMRISDTIMSIPMLLLCLAIVAALGPGIANLMIAVTFARTPSFIRIVRASIMTVVNEDYVEAARAAGSKDAVIILKHILPNAIGPIIVHSTMTVGQTILTAAGLSFIGMGITPPTPEWGSMLAEAREYMFAAPHLSILPGVFVVLSALSLNLLGDGLRDSLDPRLRK